MWWIGAVGAAGGEGGSGAAGAGAEGGTGAAGVEGGNVAPNAAAKEDLASTVLPSGVPSAVFITA